MVRSGTALVTIGGGGGAGGDGWTNVQDFGASGDGIQDDGPAIATAIASLSADGGTVFFPPGTYRITNPIAVSTNNVWLIGSGATIDNQNLSGAPALILGGQPGFVVNGGVQRLNFTGNPLSGSSIVLDLIANYLIQDVIIASGGGHGIEAPGEFLSTTFERVTVTGRGPLKDGWHISVGNQCNVIRWLECTSGNNSATSQGVYVVPFAGGVHVDWVFIGCAFESSQHGVWLNSVFAVQFIGTYFEANAGGDIRLGTLGNADSGVRVTTVMTSVANGSLLGGYFLRMEEGARLTVIGLSSTLHARTFSIVSPNEGGETVQIMNREISGDALMYEAGTTEATALPGPIKGLTGINAIDTGFPVTPRNLRGSEVITGIATTATVVFSTPEDDAAYFVQVSIGATAGGPAAGSTRAFVTGKAGVGFTINLEVAPGGAASVTVDWLIVR